MLSSVTEHPSPPGSPLLKPTANPFQVPTPDNCKHSFTTPKPRSKSHRTCFDEECSTAAPSPAAHSLGLQTPDSIRSFSSPGWGTSLWDAPISGAPEKTLGSTFGPPVDSSIAEFCLAFQTNFDAGGLDVSMSSMLPPPPEIDATALSAFLPASVESESRAFSPSPTTPRQGSPGKRAAAMSPPQTPRRGPCHIATPGAPKKQKRPLLMQVLQLAIQGLDNLDKVRAVLALDADAALEPFWDYDMEPSLCCAVRCGCSAEVIELLIKHGARVGDVNSKGQSPLDLLGSCRASPGLGLGAAGAAQNMASPVEKVLLEAGGRPQAPTEGNLENAFLEAGARPQTPTEGNLGWGDLEDNLDWGRLGMQELAWTVCPTTPAL